MVDEDVDEWLDSWIESHYENWGSIEEAVKSCRSDASTGGIAESALYAAAGGDLAAYLSEERDAIAQASGSAPANF